MDQKNEATVIEYEQVFVMATSSFQKTLSGVYEFFKLDVRAEALRKGFKVEKFYKPTRKGTKVKFKKLESTKEAEDELNDLKEAARDRNIKINEEGELSL